MSWSNSKAPEDTWKSCLKQGLGSSGSLENFNGRMDSKKSGFGSTTWTNGEKYEGSWKENKREGHGVFLFNNGSQVKKYSGNWHAGLPNGRGSLEFKDGRIIYGSFQNGDLNGSGYVIEPNGNIKKHLWSNNVCLKSEKISTKKVPEAPHLVPSWWNSLH